MLLTFGDVLAVVAALIGICVSAWTTLVAFSLLFPDRAARAASSIHDSPARMGVRGMAITGAAVLAATVMFKIHQPLPTLAAWVLVLAMFSLAALGCSGLAMVLAARVRGHEPELSPYAALMRGAALVVVPGLLPVFGWFLVGPIMLMVGVGAGSKSLRLAHEARP